MREKESSDRNTASEAVGAKREWKWWRIDVIKVTEFTLRIL